MLGYPKKKISFDAPWQEPGLSACVSSVFTFSQVRKQQMADMRGSRYFKIVNSLAIILPRHGPVHPYEILRSLTEEATPLFVYFNQLMQFPDKPHISL